MRLSPPTSKLLAACAFAILSYQSYVSAQVVYSNSFESNTNGFSSSNTSLLSTTDAGFGSGPQSTFLGNFGNQTVTLTIGGLIPGTSYDVDFDLFIGASWDGNSTGVGPDTWRLLTDATPLTLIETTFSNFPDGFQSYSDSTLIGINTFPGFTGADIVFDGDETLTRYSIHYFGHGIGNPQPSFLATGTTHTLTFGASGLQDLADEFWALDNVNVTAQTAAVPEPVTAFFGAGTALTALLVRRRRS